MSPIKTPVNIGARADALDEVEDLVTLNGSVPEVSAVVEMAKVSLAKDSVGEIVKGSPGMEELAERMNDSLSKADSLYVDASEGEFQTDAVDGVIKLIL
jgi:hypothetical protein